MVAVTSTERDVIFDAVQAMYTALATAPHGEFHFPTGRHIMPIEAFLREHERDTR